MTFDSLVTGNADFIGIGICLLFVRQISFADDATRRKCWRKVRTRQLEFWRLNNA